MKPYVAPGITGPSVTTVDYAPTRVSNPGLDWSHIAQAASGVQEAQGGARRAFEVSYKPRISRPMNIGALFPFSVYNLPPVLRVSPNSSVDWRKFRVHAGHVLGVTASNTDNAKIDSSPDYFGNFAAANDTTIPNSNASFYFWLEYGSNATNATVARVLYGPDPTATNYADSISSPSQPWDHNSAPWNSIGAWTTVWSSGDEMTPDGNHLPIANITISNTSAAAYTIKQFLNTDVLVVGVPLSGIRYRGIYDAAKDYNVNDLVYLESTALGVTTRTPFICEIKNGHSSPQTPVFPEPGTIYWRCLAGYSNCTPQYHYFQDASNNCANMKMLYIGQAAIAA